MIIHFVYSSSRRNRHVHLRDGFERRGKSTGVAKNGIIRNCFDFIDEIYWTNGRGIFFAKSRAQWGSIVTEMS